MRMAFGVIAIAACSDASSAPSPGAPDASPSDAATGVEAEASAPTTAVHRGIVVDYSTRAPIVGATVTLGEGRSATTDANGAFAITVPTGVAYTETIAQPNANTVSFAELRLTGDYDQGTFVLSSLEHTRIARGYFTDYDPAKGVALVSIGRLSTCADIAGTTIAFDPPGQAQVHYFRNYMQTTTTSAGTGEEPAAVAWNLEPGVPIAVKLTSPACKQAADPTTDGPATFSARIVTVAGGDYLSNTAPLFGGYVRAYLE